MSNSRFAIALHTLALLARSDGTLSSTAIANSVNTNPVTIRKVLGSLSCAGLTETVMGSEGGASLMRSPLDISLLDVYRATEQKSLFEHHPKPPNQDCDCGRKITPVLNCVFHDAEDAFCVALATKSLADVLHDMDAIVA
jgi:Rrf2 family protein